MFAGSTMSAVLLSMSLGGCATEHYAANTPNAAPRIAATQIDEPAVALAFDPPDPRRSRAARFRPRIPRAVGVSGIRRADDFVFVSAIRRSNRWTRANLSRSRSGYVSGGCDHAINFLHVEQYSAITHQYLYFAVVSGKSSVRKGHTGNPAELYKLHVGLSAHAYRTATG